MSLSLHQLLSKFGKSNKTGVSDFLSFASVALTEVACEEVEKCARTQFESPVWMEVRYGRVTASKIYDMAKCQTPEGSLVDPIIGASEIKDNEAMARGRNLEKRVLAELIRHFQHLKFRDAGLFLSLGYPICEESPDALGADFFVEIKRLNPEINYINSSNKIAKWYKAQIELQIFMTGRKIGYYCVAKPDFETRSTFTLLCENYDEDYITDIINKSMNFWRHYVFPRLYEAVVPSVDSN